MARRSRTSLFEDLATLAARLPAWVSFTLALVVYLVLDHFNAQPVTMEPRPGPALPSNFVAAFYRPVLIALQYIVPLAFVLGGSVSLIKGLAGLRLRSQYLSAPDSPIVAPSGPQSEARPTGTLSWDQFELLVGEAFRQQGYRVIHGGEAGPDGGVDVRLKKDGQQYLVQCKHWKTRRVGVAVIRELFGVMVDQGAKGAFIVTSGDFTEDANQFARGKSIGLINGSSSTRCCVRLVRHSQIASQKPHRVRLRRFLAPSVVLICLNGSPGRVSMWGVSFGGARGILSAALFVTSRIKWLTCREQVNGQLADRYSSVTFCCCHSTDLFDLGHDDPP